MTTILVPTDFSENAKAALDFAALLAVSQKAKLVLLHAVEFHYSSGPIQHTILDEEKKQKTSEADARMRNLYKPYEKSIREVEFKALEGPPSEIVPEYVKKNPVDLIVMGARSQYGSYGILFGTIAGRVIAKSSCPVIAVPPVSESLKPPARVSYATDFLQADLDAIKQVLTWARPFGATLCLVHVTRQGDEIADSKKLIDLLSQVKQETGYQKITTETLKGDTKKELEEYVKRKKADLLVLSATTYNGPGRLFSPSITTHLVKVSPVPVIAFHHPSREKHLIP